MPKRLNITKQTQRKIVYFREFIRLCISIACTYNFATKNLFFRSVYHWVLLLLLLLLLSFTSCCGGSTGCRQIVLKNCVCMLAAVIVTAVSLAWHNKIFIEVMKDTFCYLLSILWHSRQNTGATPSFLSNFEVCNRFFT